MFESSRDDWFPIEPFDEMNGKKLNFNTVDNESAGHPIQCGIRTPLIYFR